MIPLGQVVAIFGLLVGSVILVLFLFNEVLLEDAFSNPFRHMIAISGNS